MSIYIKARVSQYSHHLNMPEIINSLHLWIITITLCQWVLKLEGVK